MANTINRTMAKAKLAMAGGFPSGFQATNTRIAAIRRMRPKPPNKCFIVFRNHRDGGGERTFLPYCFCSLIMSEEARPSSGEVCNCSYIFSGVRICQSRSMIATTKLASIEWRSCEIPYQQFHCRSGPSPSLCTGNPRHCTILKC
jgi:hypothetical protein